MMQRYSTKAAGQLSDKLSVRTSHRPTNHTIARRPSQCFALLGVALLFCLAPASMLGVSISVGGGTLSWGVTSSTSQCGPAGAQWTVYSFSSFNFKDSAGISTNLGGGASYYSWTSGCSSSAPKGAQPATVTLTGPHYTIVFTPLNGGSGSATYIENPTLTLSASPNPSTYGTAVTLTATVSTTTDTNVVTFYNGGAVIGTATPSAGAARLTTSSLPAASNSVTASIAGSTGYSYVSSSAITVVVNAAPPTITLATSGSPSNSGANVTFTATVPVGDTNTVTFYNGATVLGAAAGSNGTAALVVATLPVGSNTITASIAGGGNYLAATSSAITQVVNGATPTISLATSGSPAPYGSPVTFTATVTPGDPNTVTFYNSGAALGSVTPLNGIAALVVSSLHLGSSTITATVAAGGSFSSASSSAITQVIVAATPSIVLTTSKSAAAFGSAVAFTASVPAADTNTVTLYDGSSSLGNAVPVGGTASITVNTLSVGLHSMTAGIAAGGNYNGATSSAIVQNIESTVANYHFQIVNDSGASGYDAVGNIQAFTDSVIGAWSNVSYDTLNRLSAAAQVPTSGAAQYYCWDYDSFGNRKHQQITTVAGYSNSVGTPCAPLATATLLANSWANYTVDGTAYTTDNGQNRLTGSPVGATTYDPAGNVLKDSVNQYLYDGEGRLCAVQYPTGVANHYLWEGYIYNADGVRVAKGSLTRFTCDTNPADTTTYNGFSVQTLYILGGGGNQLTEVASANNGQTWTTVHTNIFAGGQLLGTYSSDSTQVTAGQLYFHLYDWLGTRRQQTDYAGNPVLNFSSQPFGDNLQSTSVGSASSVDATEHHFTGKERDTESGNDYFPARYYRSSMGRWLSPDWSAKAEPVPYAKLDDPQTLNLYSYMQNNPLSGADADGHCGDKCQRFWNGFFGYGKVTDAERDARIAEQRQWLIDHTGDDATKERWENASGKEVFGAYVCLQSSSCTQKAIDAGQLALAATKPVNLPSWKSIEIDMDHVESGHMGGGRAIQSEAAGAGKSQFPSSMSKEQVERAIREAYRNGSNAGRQGDVVKVIGQGGGMQIEMWVNTATKTIESAYPKW